MKTDLFPVVILAGGLATRLRPATETIPKSLITINGEPFIDHQLRLLQQQGIREVVLCVGYLGEMVEKHVGDGSRFGLRVQYAYDGPTLLGTGGAIKNASPLLDESFFVLYGDSFLTASYKDVQNTFNKESKQGLMTVFHNAGQWDTSNIEFNNGKLIRYDKVNRHPGMQYIDYGLGILTKQALSLIKDDESYDLATLYQTLLKNDQLAAHEVSSRFYEVGSFAGIEELEYYLSHQMKENTLC